LADVVICSERLRADCRAACPSVAGTCGEDALPNSVLVTLHPFLVVGSQQEQFGMAGSHQLVELPVMGVKQREYAKDAPAHGDGILGLSGMGCRQPGRVQRGYRTQQKTAVVAGNNNSVLVWKGVVKVNNSNETLDLGIHKQ